MASTELHDQSGAFSPTGPINGNGNGDTRDYTEANIKVLEGIEAIRKRPGMYIGDTDFRGLHHCVYEIVDNSVDEALAGYCTEILVILHKDGSCSVRDNGRGFPVGIHPKVGRPAVEVCLTMLPAGGKFVGEGYTLSGGMNGGGASVANARSEERPSEPQSRQTNSYDTSVWQQNNRHQHITTH